MMRRSISDEERVEVVRLFVGGMTYREVSQALNIGTKSIASIVHAAGISPSELIKSGERVPQNQVILQSEYETIVKRYQGGESMNKLGKAYGVTPTIIRKVLARSKITPRKVGPGIRDFSEAETADIIRRWNSGESQSHIGSIYNAHQTTISRVLSYHNINPSSRLNQYGKQNGAWKGGRVIAGGGYYNVRLEPDSPFLSMRNVSGYVPEHRLIMAQHLNRPLRKDETVHHINGNKADNRIENLQLRTGRHGKYEVYRCRCCGSYDIEAVPISEGQT